MLFTRQIGAQPGVQLNPLKDSSELPAFGNADQTFAVIGRFPRGRIDKPFRVNRSNATRKLGRPEPMRASALNEAHVQTVEAVNKGAYEAIVQRLAPSGAVLNWIVVKADGTAVTAPTAPTTNDFLVAIKHLECFNDGIKVAFHADELKVLGVSTANAVITLQLLDKGDVKLYEFTGSLDADALDDNGNSFYLPNVVSTLAGGGEVEVVVPAGAKVQPNGPGYGRTASGINAWATTPVVNYFTEGGTGYITDDYMRARMSLATTDLDYGYIASGGSRAPALLTQLAQLAYESNRQLRLDVPGELSPAAAITFVNQLNITDKNLVHLVQAFWAPLKTDCPLGVNGKAVIGTSALNIAKACSRNAATNAKGFAPKNYPVAGQLFPFDRAGVQQIYSPTEQELSDLALAGINPVIYERYSAGGLYVWSDSLTSRKGNTLAKLIAVAEMSTDIDDKVVRYMKGLIQYPMSVAVKKGNDFLKDLLDGADASDWLVPSAQLGGASFQYACQPNEARPYDRMDVRYWISFDGTVRQIDVTQEIVGR
jgi:hypothetical protein